MYAVQGNHLRVVKELMTAQVELKTRDKVCHHLPLSITITCNYMGGRTHLLEGLKHNVISLLDQKISWSNALGTTNT